MKPSSLPFTRSARKVIRRDTVLDERTFERVLVLERKRSERTGDPFILACLDVSPLQGETGQVDPVIKELIFSCLLSTFRETDIVGWFEEERSASVILTELGEGSPEQAKSIAREKILRELEDCLPGEVFRKIHVVFYVFPDGGIGEIPTDVQQVLYPDLKGSNVSRKIAILLKRWVDILGSMWLILVASPVLVVIALLVKLTSRGPVLFKQERVGQWGQPFQFLKFRSMYVNNDSSIHEKYIEDFIREGKSTTTSGDGKPVFKLVEDPRVTPVGRLLRRTSLDELPQFFNVLVGDMSLVGPRPPIRYELEKYDHWHRRRIHEVRPGITGLWQVNGRSRTTFDEMVRMDLLYARNWSIWTDFILLVKTPLAVIRGDGAV